ncbi:MAG: hypothetical protein ACREF3_20675 [Acetobacteraceae bacterium]
MDVTIALALHVLSIVLWIGGAGFATMALLPALRTVRDTEQRIATFQAVEHRFAPVARASVIVAGVTGLYMVYRLDAWNWFTMASFWWMHAMVLVWVLFAALLFIVEPFIVHRHFATRARAAPDAMFRRMQVLHWVLVTLALITIVGAVAGSRGMFG